MTNRILQFNEIYDELDRLRVCVKDLVAVATNLMDRVEKLEGATLEVSDYIAEIPERYGPKFE